jgi:c(7)-type cytochrome triheme protein
MWRPVGLVVLLAAFFLLASQQASKKTPERLTFKSGMGNVTFDHAAHVRREKGDCKVCHDSLFSQSATTALNYKPNIHKTAESNKTSCAHCHVAGGKSFESKANCQRCHVKK